MSVQANPYPLRLEKIYMEKINNNFGWKIKNGQGVLIKLMELDKDEK